MPDEAWVSGLEPQVVLVGYIYMCCSFSCIIKANGGNFGSIMITSCRSWSSSVKEHFDYGRCNNSINYCLLYRVSFSDTMTRVLCKLGSYDYYYPM